jgi:glycosyltransferase involved in cell wall biosynthesis
VPFLVKKTNPNNRTITKPLKGNRLRIIYWIGRIGDKFGSLERYNILLAQACNQRGHELIIVHDIPNTVPEYAQCLRDAKAQFLVNGHSYANPLYSFSNAVHLVRAWKPDVVHTHFVNPVALPLLKFLNVPLLYQTYHSGIDHEIRLRTRIIRWGIQLCTKRIFAVSNRVRNDEIRVGINPSHIFTLPLGLAIQDFLNASKTIIGPYPNGFNDPNKKIIITVGRFFPEKGMRYSVEAAIEVCSKRQDVIWWLVGKDGPEKAYSWSLVQAAGLENRILFLGQRNDVPFLMQRAYVQVVGSLYEGLGLMALESSAFGIPTVGTQVGGLDEAIINGKTGLLVPKKSSAALAEATLRLLDNPELRNQLGREAKKYLADHFDANQLVEELLDIYEKDLG